MTVDSYLHRGRNWAQQLGKNPRIRQGCRVVLCGLTGFCLSAAGLLNSPQTFALGLITALSGWKSLVVALGSGLGYGFFWGAAGSQGGLWSLGGAIVSLTLGKSRLRRESPLLVPAICALIPALTGLIFQLLGVDTPTLVYLLRVALGAASAALFSSLVQKRENLTLWAAEGIAVLSLVQISPVLWLNPGVIAAGMLGVSGAFPAAVLAGLALDLARLGPVPMTAVMSALCVARMIPGIPRWTLRLLPGPVYLLVMVLSGSRVLLPVPALVLGGFLSVLLPGRPDTVRRRGRTGMAQLRLEAVSQVLLQTRLMIMEQQEPPIEEEALLQRTRERACGGCPNRKSCQLPRQIPRELLHRPMTENTSLPFPCRKPGRMVLEIRRTQEQYRLLRGDRDRRREYRSAVSQQYLFLSAYLEQLSQELSQKPNRFTARFSPEVAWKSRSREAENGDAFRHFSGPGCCHYLLLCDGMGTGWAAAREARTAVDLLQRLLCAGFPAEQALESMNSLLILRGRAGAVTVDLARIRLDTGEASLYKWGASPSWVARGGMVEKIGTAGPPPGLDLSRGMEKAVRLSLKRGETLILASDGLDGEGIQSRAGTWQKAAAGELAAYLLEAGAEKSADDATVAVVRLHRSGLLT
jgi:hypothetical protein